MSLVDVSPHAQHVHLPVPRRLSWSVRIALTVVALLVFAALAAPLIAPYDPNLVDLGSRLQGSSAEHWLGADHLGRDMLSRLLYGTRVSLGSVAICLVLILALGIGIGGVSGIVGGRADQIIMRVCEVFMTFPIVVLALLLIGVLGTGLVNVIIAITLAHWAWYARLVRGLVLSYKERDFMLAARAAGASRLQIFTEHLLPAILSQLVVLTTLDIGHMMLHVSGLSFLGLGVQTPTAEWGVMISDARQFVWTNPMLIVWPGVALLITVMAFNIMGDALRDRLDPALRAAHAH